MKRNQSGSTLVSVGGGRGQYQATNVTINLLLTQAFRLPGSQIIGAPEWAQNDRYDIVAKMPLGRHPRPARPTASCNDNLLRNRRTGRLGSSQQGDEVLQLTDVHAEQWVQRFRESNITLM